MDLSLLKIHDHDPDRDFLIETLGELGVDYQGWLKWWEENGSELLTLIELYTRERLRKDETWKMNPYELIMIGKECIPEIMKQIAAEVANEENRRAQNDAKIDET